jgi:hypothetical protein
MMNIIACNFRGIGHETFSRFLFDIITTYKTSLLILCETHCSGPRAQAIIQKLGLPGNVVVDASGHSRWYLVLAERLLSS